MRYKKSILIFAICTTLVFDYFGQVNVKDSSVVAPLICSSYSAQIPGGDMAKRFGFNSAIELQFLLKTKKNWIFGASADFILGNQVRETGMLDSIKTTDGFLISNDGKLADTRFLERGFSAFVKFGKLFPVWGVNPNCGMFATAGVGILEHKIRIELIDGTEKTVPQLTDEIKKGYDRLSNGIAFTQCVGYLFLSNNRITNFFFSLEVTEAFTKNRRSYDYDLMKQDDRARTDLLYGVRLGWVLPVYKRVPREFYTY